MTGNNDENKRLTDAGAQLGISAGAAVLAVLAFVGNGALTVGHYWAPGPAIAAAASEEVARIRDDLQKHIVDGGHPTMQHRMVEMEAKVRGLELATGKTQRNLVRVCDRLDIPNCEP